MKTPLFYSNYRPFSIFTFVLCIIFLTACNKDDDTPMPLKADIWFSDSRGFYLDQENGANILYSTSTAGTVLFDEDFDLSDFEVKEIGDELHVRSKGSLTPIIFDRVEKVPEVIAPTTDAQVNYDVFWNLFNDYYVFFDEKGVDWEAQKSIRETVTEGDLFDVMSEAVLLLEDGHVNIINDEGFTNSGMYELAGRLNAHLDPADQIVEFERLEELFEQKQEIIVGEYLDGEVKTLPDYPIFWGEMAEGVAYLNIAEMSEYGGEENVEASLANVERVMDEVMNYLQEAEIEKLIIDVRFNGGGEDLVSLAIAARFFDQERMVFSKKARDGDGYTSEHFVNVKPKGGYQFTKEIVLLTSPFTASAAEIFSLAIQELPHATVVGEFTQGTFSDMLPHVLPNGTQVTLSNEVYYDAKGVSMETVGVGPKNEEDTVPFLQSTDLRNGIDGGIDRALEVLK